MLLTNYASHPMPIEHPKQVPLLRKDEEYTDFIRDCECFVEDVDSVRNNWILNTANPIFYLWFSRDERMAEDIEDTYWRQACILWLQRKSR